MGLLGLTLPGIDANDIGKTTAAYKFYYRMFLLSIFLPSFYYLFIFILFYLLRTHLPQTIGFLTSVPIFEGGDGSTAQSEHDNEAFSASYTFSDWAVSFVDQTLSFVSFSFFLFYLVFFFFFPSSFSFHSNCCRNKLTRVAFQ